MQWEILNSRSQILRRTTQLNVPTKHLEDIARTSTRSRTIFWKIYSLRVCAVTTSVELVSSAGAGTVLSGARPSGHQKLCTIPMSTRIALYCRLRAFSVNTLVWYLGLDLYSITVSFASLFQIFLGFKSLRPPVMVMGVIMNLILVALAIL